MIGLQGAPKTAVYAGWVIPAGFTFGSFKPPYPVGFGGAFWVGDVAP